MDVTASSLSAPLVWPLAVAAAAASSPTPVWTPLVTLPEVPSKQRQGRSIAVVKRQAGGVSAFEEATSSPMKRQRGSPRKPSTGAAEHSPVAGTANVAKPFLQSEGDAKTVNPSTRIHIGLFYFWVVFTTTRSPQSKLFRSTVFESSSR